MKRVRGQDLLRQRSNLVDVEKSNSGEVNSQCLGEVEFKQAREDEVD